MLRNAAMLLALSAFTTAAISGLGSLAISVACRDDRAALDDVAAALHDYVNIMAAAHVAPFAWVKFL